MGSLGMRAAGALRYQNLKKEHAGGVRTQT
jgi:hypothetical protein